MRKLAIGFCLLLVSACMGNGSVGVHAGIGKTWRLESVNGVHVNVHTDLIFGRRGLVSGKTGCNTWQAEQTAPYPWFEVEDVTKTEVACPSEAAQKEFFEALKKVSVSEITGDTMILSTPDGYEMVFKSGPAA